MSLPAAQVMEVHQDEILTGEAVALDVQPVGFFLRAVGTVIDMIAMVVLLLAFWAGVAWITGSGADVIAIYPMLTIVTIVVMWVLVPTAVETLTRGRSLGRLAVGSRIVRVDGGTAGFRHAFIRALSGVLELWMTLGGIAALVGIFTPRAQRLGDLLAGTYAERTRTPRLPPPTDPLPGVLIEWARIADVRRLPDRVARRAAQFVRGAQSLDPGARTRTAVSLATELRDYVAPVPNTDPETFVRGVVAIRRDREYRALIGENERVARLTAGLSTAPRDFPIR